MASLVLKLIPFSLLGLLLIAPESQAACIEGARSSCEYPGGECPGEKVCNDGQWSDCEPRVCNPVEISPTLRSVGLGTANEIFVSRTSSGLLRPFVHSRVFSLIAQINSGPAVQTLRMSGTVGVTCELDGVETTFTSSFQQDQNGNGTTAGLSFSRTFDTSTAVCPTGYRRLSVSYEARTTVILANAGGTFATYPGKAEYLRWLKFMTWNIHHGVGRDGVLNLQAISNTLLASGAHFAGFQDVDNHWSGRSDCQNQPAMLQQQTGMSMRYSPSVDEGGNIFQCGTSHRKQYGNLLLSRFPIVADSIGFLYHPVDYERRSALSGVVSIGGTQLTIVSSHLHHGTSPTDGLIRNFQAESLMVFISNHAGPAPKILMADLNAPENAAELSWVNAGMQDAWFAAGNPSSDRIDYIYTTPGLPVARAFKLPSNASDHDAVMAWVALEPATVP
ncbi:endonuclease/exonuclease/phosphatase family protein [Myxococcus faecalis]|uniref:endonuclease/exonuclease/phosphatase family protein n=1 Tax=Myxococcus faecalis TaxID=3115646 RepID=UPI003CF347C8